MRPRHVVLLAFLPTFACGGMMVVDPPGDGPSETTTTRDAGGGRPPPAAPPGQDGEPPAPAAPVAVEYATEAPCTGVPPTVSTGIVKHIDASWRSTCALLEDQTVKCWGWATATLAPATVPGLSGVVGITPGGHHWCAMLEGGTVSCWGSNYFGSLGDGSGDGTHRMAPALVPGLTDVVELGASVHGTVARRADGSAYFWGTWYDFDGWAENVTSPTPAVVTAFAGATALGVGYGDYCAVKDGTVRCVDSDQALTTYALPGVVDAEPSAPYTCALTAAGRVACWPRGGEPREVLGLANVTAISGGDRHTCALTCGRVACWGENFHGALGDGTRTDRYAPVMVPGLDDIVGIATGLIHSCALRADGATFCWGANWWGELGDGTGDDRILPRRVAGF